MTDGRLLRRIIAGGVAVALLAGGVVIGASVGGDDESANEPTASTAATAAGESATTTAVPSGAGSELVALIESGQAGTYHARYQTDDPTSGLGPLIVDVFRQGTTVRQDAVISSGERSIETAAFIDPDGVLSCQRPIGGDWVCEEVPPEQAPDIDGRIRDAVAAIASRTTGVRDEIIAGAPAQCYDLTDEDGDALELCVNADGVPARFVRGEAGIQLLLYEPTIPEGIFTPPA